VEDEGPEVAALGERPEAAYARGTPVNKLRYVYTGNVHDTDGDTTRCPSCDATVIVRDWYEIPAYRLTDAGHCPHCGTPIAGRFEAYGLPFGARRIPVAIHRHGT